MALARDAYFVAKTLDFSDLVPPLDQLRSALEDGRVAPPPQETAPAQAAPTVFRIGAATDVPFGSRGARVMGGRVWGDDARPLSVPDGETRTDADLARIWSRIIGKRDASMWIVPDGRVIVEHSGRHWIVDIIGPSRVPQVPGEPLTGWVIERCKALLDTNGSIWDYVSGRMYFDADAQLGQRLLHALPEGGPIQVTADGSVGARIDESGESIYLASLDESELAVFLA